MSTTSSGIEVYLTNGDKVFFGVQYARDLLHTFEYYWNKYCVANRMEVKMGSTHGRPLVSMHTLSGETPAPEAVIGVTEIIDQDGMPVRPGGKIARRQSLMGGLGIGGSQEPQVVPPENHHVKAHWHKVVKHQGWLLKKGGVGIGSSKQWIKRYFVLYGTSQGHFMSYYSDFTECPMYTSERNHRNVIDMCKACYIRPGSTKSEESDTPPNSFDIVTTEREWTLCAETQENMQKWLKLLTRAVDEDVAILPDEELVFKVKPKMDPLGQLPSTDYTTSLKCSAFGVSVTTPERDSEREQFFWIYTDFYKWSLLTQNGKMALLVNVFANETFTRRNEFVFRHKEADRLATCIEYFIEKFMSVMHIRLEIIGLPEETAVYTAAEIVNTVVTTDLLDIGSPLDVPSYAPPPPQQALSELSLASVPQQANLFGSSTDDLFGSDPFASSPVKHSAAPPLSQAQLSQHVAWFKSSLVTGFGPIYDDGCLMIAVKIEMNKDTNKSQGKIIFYEKNVTAQPMSGLSLGLSDPVGMLRYDLKQPNPQLGPGLTQESTLDFECLKPSSPEISLSVEYNGPFGRQAQTVRLPLLVTSFNEPYVLNGSDFSARWQSLAQQDVQEIIRPAAKVDFQQLRNVVGTVSFILFFISLYLFFPLFFSENKFIRLEI